MTKRFGKGNFRKLELGCFLEERYHINFMKIQFLNDHNIIPSGGSIKLPKFVVLTGKNGSGKTQLFEGISRGAFKVLDADDNAITKIVYIQSGTLSVRDNAIFQPIEDKADLEFIFNKVSVALQNGTGLSTSNRDRRQATKYTGFASTLIRQWNAEGRKEISYDEMVESFEVIEKRQAPSNIFDDQFSASFSRYFLKKRKNQYNRFLASEGEEIAFLTDEEFIVEEGPPPWTLIDEVLKHAKIPYTVTFPVDEKIPFKAQLRSLHNPETVINFSQLSSGERTLCKLAIAIYQSSNATEFPELLLLDEPDAHLHPSMTKQMIDTLVDSFLPHIKHGIVISTHSPSTCALAPDSSLFYMQSDTRRPKPIEVDNALSELCIGIPTLSIRKENERQVFVESNVDAELYTSIWRRIQKTTELESVPSLNFISSGKAWRTGSCEQAQDLCMKLRDGGSTSCFAIIDSDGKNESNEHIFVLGEGEGYAIENFILNPLSIAALLIHLHGDLVQYDFLRGRTIVDFKALSEEEYQIVSDGICSTLVNRLGEYRANKGSLEKKFPEIELCDNRTLIEIISGLKLNIPVWYNKANGHKLEKLILSVFPELLYFGREDEAGKLMTAVCTHIFGPIPEIIPLSLSETLMKLTQ